MMYAPRAVTTDRPGSLSGPERRAGSSSIVVLGGATRRTIEQAMCDALGSGCTLEMGIDDDILPFPGRTEDLRDVLVAIARDARAALGGCGVLQFCALNVFDRCGGNRDQVLIVLSFAAPLRKASAGSLIRPRRPQRVPFPAAASSHVHAMRFADRFHAECELVEDHRTGTTLSLLLPAAARGR